VGGVGFAAVIALPLGRVTLRGTDPFHRFACALDVRSSYRHAAATYDSVPPRRRPTGTHKNPYRRTATARMS
jgi:hypothetical protein